jgi:hypothetical protein
MKQRRTCPRGHVFYKSSDCPTCPSCEAARRPAGGFLAGLPAPARRALENAGLTTEARLARRTAAQVLDLHGMGPGSLPVLRAALKKKGLKFAPSGNKTMPTKSSVARFLSQKASGEQLADCRELVKLFRTLTRTAPKMWGPSIVGFGSYHYVYPSGREGDAPLIGFSPRGRELSIYLCSCIDAKPLLAKLGRHKAGAGCLYIRSLEDVDCKVLTQIAKASIAELRKRYG